MRNRFNGSRDRRTGKVAGAALMLALWIGAVVFASSAQLHSQVCPDAKDSSHQCAIASVAQGFIAACLASLTVTPAPVDLLVDASIATCQPIPVADVRLAPGRAPPSFFAVL